MKSILICIAVSALFSTTSCTNAPQSAQDIVDAAIEKAGGDHYLNSEITFDFRDMSYSVRRQGGLFELTRTQYPSTDSTIVDTYHNYGFQRTLNDSMISVPDSMVARYSSSINSVIYFFNLPFGLNDPAVNKELIGSSIIDQKQYHKIHVFFNEEGGGMDHQDQFYYWIDQDSLTVDYLAYSYQSDGGGLRFRKAINPRYVNGIRVVDYLNYKPLNGLVTLENIETTFIDGGLELLSKIENDNVSVTPLD